MAAATLGLCLIAWPAFGYVGPGLAAGAVAAVIGILGSVCLAIAGVLYYPLKRLLRSIGAGRRGAAEQAEPAPEQGAGAAAAGGTTDA